MKCQACSDRATHEYVALDEPDYPHMFFCDGCSERWPPSAGVHDRTPWESVPTCEIR